MKIENLEKSINLHHRIKEASNLIQDIESIKETGDGIYIKGAFIGTSDILITGEACQRIIDIVSEELEIIINDLKKQVEEL